VEEMVHSSQYLLLDGSLEVVEAGQKLLGKRILIL
jgi:hypothetical protein